MLRNLRPREALLARTAAHLSAHPALLVVAFSLVYFTDVCIRASEKYFWFDELCTLYICRLPTFHQSWQAVLNGVDYNPPLFYVIMRAVHSVLGEGLIAFRLPAIFGFWIFCLCLFCVVYSAAGTLPAFIAMTLPMLSGAYYYAYEARPHAIVLGFCGLSILFWQLASERPADPRPFNRKTGFWLILFSASLMAASLTHCYAILLGCPFAWAELFHAIRFRQLRWTIWAAIIAPGVAGALCLVPLLRTYRHVVKGTAFGNLYFRADLSEIAPFYIALLASCTLLLLFAFTLFALDQIGCFAKTPGDEIKLFGVTHERIVLALAFIVFPVIGLLIAKVMGGPFIPRYFVSALAGFCLMLGWWVAYCSAANRIALILSVVIAGMLCKHTLALLSRHSHGIGEYLTEPSSGLVLNTTPGNPLSTNSLLLQNSGGSLPIMIDSDLLFFYLTNYAPELSSRLYLVSWSATGLGYRLTQAVRVWCHVNFNHELTFDEFVASNKNFLLYGTQGSLWEVSKFMELGREVKSLKSDSNHILVELEAGETNGNQSR